MSGPPFRAEHVGSMLRPQKLLLARASFETGDVSQEGLGEIERDAIATAVAVQERAGLKVVTDGEMRRLTWNHDFLATLDNVVFVDGEPRTLKVHGRLGRSVPIVVDDFTYLRSIATAAPKISIPGPDYMLGRGRAVDYERDVYPDDEAFAADIAELYRQEIADLAAAGCRHLQLDDPNFSFLCDPEHRARAEAQAGIPVERLLDSYVQVINAALTDRPAEMTVTLHTCRGNFRSMSFARGGYAAVAERLFGQLAVDGYLLEFHDQEICGDFSVLSTVPEDKFVVLGLVSTKTGELEDRAAVRDRINEASKHIELDRLALGTQCGFASTVEGNLLTAEQEEAKLALIVELAGEVWS